MAMARMVSMWPHSAALQLRAMAAMAAMAALEEKVAKAEMAIRMVTAAMAALVDRPLVALVAPEVQESAVQQAA